MKRYRICFGLPPVHDLDSYLLWLSMQLDSFGVFRLQGYWHGTSEDAVTIEYVGAEVDEPTLRYIARRTRQFFGQESVLFTVEPIQAEFING